MCDNSKVVCESLVSSSNLCMDQDMYQGGSMPPSPRGCPSPAEAKAYPSYHVEVIRHSAPLPPADHKPPRSCDEITSCNRSWPQSPIQRPFMQQQQEGMKVEIKMEEVTIRSRSNSGEGSMGPPTDYRPRRPSGGEFARPLSVPRSGDIRAMHLAARGYNPQVRRLQDHTNSISSGRPDELRPPDFSSHNGQDGSLVLPSSSSGGARPRVSPIKKERKEEDVSSSIPDL
ncbi:unnamed protein product, partial [Meganyctiphanes norvegica]